MNIHIRTYRVGDEPAVIALWQACGLLVPWNNPHSDIQRKLDDSPELFFIAENERDLVGTCMAGYDGHRGWLYYLAVDKTRRRQGIASQLVGHAEAVLKAHGCPKLELMVRETNSEVLAFYRHLQYRDEAVQVLSKRLARDAAHGYLSSGEGADSG